MVRWQTKRAYEDKKKMEFEVFQDCFRVIVVMRVIYQCL